jgi:hypothetical protein
MEDRRNFIEQTLARGEADGVPVTKHAMVESFQLMGPKERLDVLEAIKRDVDNTDFSVEKAAKLHLYRRALVDEHRRLKAIQR